MRDPILSPDLIERDEATPDTVVTTICETRCIVTETVDELLDRACEYRADVIAAADRFDGNGAAVKPLRVGVEVGESGDTEPPSGLYRQFWSSPMS